VGKSFVAGAIAEALTADGWDVDTVSEDTLRLPRATVYGSGGAEKQARAAILAHVERRLAASRVVIVDAMNYIKGFRYQLWCSCKEGTGPSCVVNVSGSPEASVAANSARPAASDSYPGGA